MTGQCAKGMPTAGNKVEWATLDYALPRLLQPELFPQPWTLAFCVMYFLLQTSFVAVMYLLLSG